MERLEKRRIVKLLFLVLSIFSLVGCAEDTYSDVVDIKDGKWAKGENAIFEFSPIGASRTSEISVFIRTTTYYKGQNIRLTVKTIDPDHRFWEDVIVIPVKSCTGTFTTSQMIVRQGIIWPKDGFYAISIRPEEDLVGVQAIGIEITNAREKQTTN